VRNDRGVTLMELIIVVAIVAVLVSVGYPSYTRTKIESRRADAQISVVSVEAAIERYLLENNQATFESGDLSLSQWADYSTSSGTPVYSNEGYYRITIVPDSSGYTVTATATAAGGLTDCETSGNEDYQQCRDTECRTISIDHGAKVSADDSSSTTTTCW